jgi:hypothetical protein
VFPRRSMSLPTTTQERLLRISCLSSPIFRRITDCKGTASRHTSIRKPSSLISCSPASRPQGLPQGLLRSASAPLPRPREIMSGQREAISSIAPIEGYALIFFNHGVIASNVTPAGYQHAIDSGVYLKGVDTPV